MTTLATRRLRAFSATELTLVAGVAVWALVAFALRLGFVGAPASPRMLDVVTYAVPGALLVATFVRRADPGVLPVLAGAATLVALALVLPAQISQQPKIAYALPAAAVAGLVTQRYPAASLIAVFALTGIYGSLGAFTHLPSDAITDWALEGVWVGVIGRHLLGHRSVTVRVTPVMFLLIAFLMLSFVAAITTPGTGIRAFRLGPQYLSVVLLIGYAGFRPRDLDRVARTLVFVIFIVDAYAALRWAIGPAAAEKELQRTELARQFNQLAYSQDIKVQGTFPTGNALGIWLACTTPFVVAAALSWRGAVRLAAILTLPLATIALLGSSRRAAAVAVVSGLLAIVVVHVVSRGYRGPRLGVAVATIVALIVSAAVIFPLVVDNPEKRERYTSLLNPSEDPPFQARLRKWGETLDALEGHPVGFGLGAGNPSTVGHRFADIAQIEIDNSYLMIAYDQGIPVAVFFALTLIVLLIELLRHAVWTRGPGAAVLSTAAVGTLTAIMIEFVASNCIATRPMIAGWVIVGLGVAAFSRAEGGSARARPVHVAV